MGKPRPKTQSAPGDPATNPPAVLDVAAMLAGLTGNPGVLDEAVREPTVLPLTGGVTMREPHQVDLEELLGSDADGPPVHVEPDGSVTFQDFSEMTVGEVITDQSHATASEPYMPGFAMSDEPLPPPGAGIRPSATAPAVEGPQQETPTSPPGSDPAGAAITPIDMDIISPRERRLAMGSVRYEGRIRIMEAFQYMGSVAAAPAWIDRNWISFADHDDLRGIPAGPALRVPLLSGNTAVARIGDYIVQQEVLLGPGMPTDLRVEVWAKPDFEKNFLPVT